MTPLFKKLNLGSHAKILVLGAPSSFDEELAQLDDIKILRNATAKTRVGFSIGFAVTVKRNEKMAISASGKKLVKRR